ncbi:UNVERIFIED_CONTAM: hypothetical protein K2H54_028513 [Gekko kuhli]
MDPSCLVIDMSTRCQAIGANSRLKQIEKEYSQKLAKSAQIIAELKTTISSLTEESNQQQLAAERHLQDVLQKFEDEKQQLIRDNDRAIKVMSMPRMIGFFPVVSLYEFVVFH